MLILPKDFSDLVHPDAIAYSVCFSARAADDAMKPQAKGFLPDFSRSRGEAAAVCIFTDGSSCLMPRGYFKEFTAHESCAAFYEPGLENKPNGLYIVANLANIKMLEGNIDDSERNVAVTFGLDSNLRKSEWDLPLASVRDQLLANGFDFDVYKGAIPANKRFANFKKNASSGGFRRYGRELPSSLH